MKLRVLGLAAAATAALLLSACSAGTPAAGPSTAPSSGVKAPAGLVDSSSLTACIDPEYAPLEYYKNGSSGDIIGFDADSIRSLAAYWGLQAKFNVTSFDGLMPALQSGRCDIIFGGLYQSEARKAISDSSPIMNAGPAAITTPDLADRLTTPEDLCGRRVVTQAASSNSASVTALSQKCVSGGKKAIQHSDYPQTAQTVLAVINGKADVLVETNVAAAYIVSQNSGKLAVAKSVFDPDTTFGVFTRKGDQLSAPLATALKALYEDGTWAKNAEKYSLDKTIVDVYK